MNAAQLKSIGCESCLNLRQLPQESRLAKDNDQHAKEYCFVDPRLETVPVSSPLLGVTSGSPVGWCADPEEVINALEQLGSVGSMSGRV